MYSFLEKVGPFKKMYDEEKYYRPIPIAEVGKPIKARTVFIKDIGLVLAFNSLNYLGDEFHQLVDDSMAVVDETYGARFDAMYGRNSTSSSALLELEESIFCEKILADFRELPKGWSCMLMNTGHATAASALKFLIEPLVVTGVRLAGKKPVDIYYDQFVHASMQEVILPHRKKSSRNNAIRFRHLDYDQLEDEMSKRKSDGSDSLIVVDSLYSMLGTFVDVQKLYAIAKEYGAHIFMDNAHSDGVYGPKGRGLLFEPKAADLDATTFFQVGTMSKTLAATQGGYVTMPEDLVFFGKRSINAKIFSVGAAANNIRLGMAAAIAVQSDACDVLREKVCQISAFAREMFLDNGFDIQGSESHIMSVLIGEGRKSVDVESYIFREHKILAALVTAGTVEGGKSSLRIPLNASHTEEDVSRLVEALKAARDLFSF